MLYTIYNAFIYPLEVLLELVLETSYSFTNSYGLSIVLLSITINVLLSPFYSLADLWQGEEQLLLKKMKLRQEEIKAVFKGDEKHFYLKTLYRHTGYSPFLSVRSSFGLLIQIPFFMAAYNFLSGYSVLNGESFLFLANLGKPDRLFGPVNIMPLLMTGINLAGAVRYTKGQSIRSQIQLYGMALLFLVLLYGSPSGLLLYWTCNNIFSAVRIFIKDSRLAALSAKIPVVSRKLFYRITPDMRILGVLIAVSYGVVGFLFVGKIFKQSEFALVVLLLKILFYYFAVAATLHFIATYKNNFPCQINALILFFLWIGAAGFAGDPLRNRNYPYFFICLSLLMLTSVILSLFQWFNSLAERRKLIDEKQGNALFVKAIVSLFILAISTVPFLLLNHAPGEILLSMHEYGELLLWGLIYLVLVPLFIYRAHPGEYRKPLSLVFVMVLFAAIINFLFFSGDYGFINNSLQFSRDVEDSTISRLFNLAVIGFSSFSVVLLVLLKKTKWLNAIASLVMISFLCLSLFTLVQMVPHRELLSSGTEQDDEVYPEIPFSKTAENTVVLLLDGAMNSGMAAALEATPELKDHYDGFVWFRNTISYGNATIMGLPPILGGYDYTPAGMTARPEMTIFQKVMESWTILPEIFLEMGHSVYISDPDYTALDSQYKEHCLDNLDVTVSNLKGRFREIWLKENLEGLTFDGILLRSKSFFMFSVFRMAPNSLREVLYNKGVWFSSSPDRKIRERTGNWAAFRENLNSWSALDYLPELSFLQDDPSFIFIDSMITHEHGGIGPDYNLSPASFDYPAEDIKHYGSEYAASLMYINIASHRLVADWLEWMKEEDVYDNTQILVVADHGMEMGDSLGDGIVPREFLPLMMYKPFHSKGPLAISDEFMTNADGAGLVTSSFGQFVNPYTGNPLDGRSIKESPKKVVSGFSEHILHKGLDFSITKAYEVDGNALEWDCWKENTGTESF